MDFSIKPSMDIHRIYSYIENELAVGEYILVDLHYGSHAKAALEPQLTVVVKHFFDKGCKIVFISSPNEGPAMFEKFQSRAPEVFAGKQYGIDYLFLGGVSDDMGVQSLAQSISETVESDYYNMSVATLPIMKHINGAKSFALAFILSADVEVFEWYINWWTTPYHVPLLLGTLNPTAHLVKQYLENKCVIGIMAGYRAAAEYEILLHREGSGLNTVRIGKFVYIVNMLFMILGNSIVFYMKSKKPMS